VDSPRFRPKPCTPPGLRVSLFAGIRDATLYAIATLSDKPDLERPSCTRGGLCPRKA